MEVCTYQQEELDEVKLYKELGGILPTINSLNDLINELHTAFERNSVNVELIHYLMQSYKSNPIEWKKYAKFDRYRYTRNLVDIGNGKYNLMILCWGEGHGSAIHDHADSHCFMKMLDGSLEEIRFAWPEKDGEQLKEIRRTRLATNDVCYINDSMGLHRMENPSHVDGAISLHLYCPPYSKCTVFNQNTGQNSTSTLTFWSMYGKRRTKSTEEIATPEDN
ncbi:hypothetical protein RI129_002089 [Pyrocoelia pectoralis]|uniref:Cysteine dioxygenase n=1 Tax=Pyrocoelia pectoralis TaxID=417401 RepID=A0AAN7ZLS0_9COLE